MPEKVSFVHKLLKRLDRIDRESVQNYFRDLAQENGLYQEILHHLDEGVILLARDGRIRFVNRQAASWLELPAKIPRSKIQDVLEDSQLSHFLAQHLEPLKEKMVGRLQILVPREIYLQVILIPLEASETGEVLMILSNLGPEKSVELHDEDSRRIESLVSLAAGVAHEIGNPLNAVMIHLELLKKEMKDLPPSKRKNVEKTLGVLNAETLRLDKIIRNFLKATRRPPLRFKMENLNGILEEAIGVMRPELEEHRTAVHFRPDPSLPPFLLDRERLHQGFINLIKNAMEAMPKAGHLWIHTARKENVVLVGFKDEGSGIQEKDLPHIFETYYTTKEEGSGLGLMTVFHAVREHGGRIEVESKVGEGTTFTLLLPIRKPKLQLPQYRSKT